MAITITDIEHARATLRGVIHPTPMLPDDRLGAELGVRVVYKAENTQRSGSFKLRGAYNKINSLNADERQRGVVAHSAGNHAQGVALAAQLLGIPATIVMPEHAPLTKVMSTPHYGAEVILAGESFDEAGATAYEIQRARSLTFVHAFNDDLVIAGQGTIGLEVAEALPELTTIIVPVGGGGLISGIATALRALLPNVRIIGVQSAACAPVQASLAAGEPITWPTANTIADGIAVKRPGDKTLPIIKELVDEIVTVNDDEICRAIAYCAQSVRLVVEGAGAAGLAALIAGKVALKPGDVVCPLLCGGNIDGNLLARVIEQALLKQGRYILLRTTVGDRPGNLAPLISHVAAIGANVIDIIHRRAVWLGPIDRVGIEMILEVRDEEHGQSVLKYLGDTGYLVERGGNRAWPG